MRWSARGYAMDKRPIGVFDSGMGGLTAVRQLQVMLPGEDIVYFGDTGRVPYGTRSPETIRQYAEQDIRFLLSQDVKFLLAACGTVSSTLPKSYTEALPVPYVGVVGAAVAAAAAATKNGRIGVIATPASIRSRSYETRIRDILPDAEIFTRSCPMFVPLVENGYVGPNDPITTAIAHEYLDEIRAKGVDTLILGCTHYPLIAHIIAQVMGPDVTLIDSGREAALKTRDMLTRMNLLSDAGQGTTRYFMSDSPESFSSAVRLFIGPQGEGTASQIAIEQY